MTHVKHMFLDVTGVIIRYTQRLHLQNTCISGVGGEISEQKNTLESPLKQAIFSNKRMRLKARLYAYCTAAMPRCLRTYTGQKLFFFCEIQRPSVRCRE